MHSKFLGHHILELLTDSACQAIKQQSLLYTWSAVNRLKKEIDGLTILVLVLTRIHPNFKVDVYLEIMKFKKLTDNDVQLYFDVIKFSKLQIDQKNPTAPSAQA
jgi:hypothetical protein